MSRLKKIFHNLLCNGCGCLYDAEMWHEESDTLEIVAVEQGWKQISDRHYCPDCWEYDDEDNVIIKPKEQCPTTK